MNLICPYINTLQSLHQQMLLKWLFQEHLVVNVASHQPPVHRLIKKSVTLKILYVSNTQLKLIYSLISFRYQICMRDDLQCNFGNNKIIAAYFVITSLKWETWVLSCELQSVCHHPLAAAASPNCGTKWNHAYTLLTAAKQVVQPENCLLFFWPGYFYAKKALMSECG